MSVKRVGSVIGVKASHLEEYERLHAKVWESILQKIQAVHIRNYSIFLRKLPDGQHYLFSYFEYHGEDYEADMALMAADPTTQEWWELCNPCQQPLSDIADGQWWAPMKEVFHTD